MMVRESGRAKLAAAVLPVAVLLAPALVPLIFVAPVAGIAASLGCAACVAGCALLPLAFGMGPIYAVGAGAGGALFLRASARLAREPGVATARASFRASLVQLTLLLVAAIADRAM